MPKSPSTSVSPSHTFPVEWLRKHWWKILSTILSLLGSAAVALVVLGFKANSLIDERLEKKVTGEEFLGKIARKVRPYLIFDTRGSIVNDFGAADYVDKIDIVPVPESYGYRVNLKVKQPLSFPPIISGINVSLVAQSCERTQMHDWNVLLAPNLGLPAILGAEGEHAMDTNGVNRFRLEILH
jgi:hypothetical protein